VLYLYLSTGTEEIHEKSVMTAGASAMIGDTRWYLQKTTLKNLTLHHLDYLNLFSCLIKCHAMMVYGKIKLQLHAS
jgi:hypothetical protein